MERDIPENLRYFLKNALKDVEDGYEYANELNRILNSEVCQSTLKDKEIEVLKDYSEKVKHVGEINHYSEVRVKEIEEEVFGHRGILGFLGVIPTQKPQWPF